MARLTEGILGPFSGKVGTVVGYRWRGVPCVRGYVRQINYPSNRLSASGLSPWYASPPRPARR